jgi:hypothetical protein
MHLPGESDASYLLSAQFPKRQGFANRQSCSPPPIFWQLFGPADLG